MTAEVEPTAATLRAVSGTVVSAVRFEHRDSGLGVGTGTPRLSWQVTTDDSDWVQTSYELDLDSRTVIRVKSEQQVLVPWPFDPLASRTRATVRVGVASGKRWSDWSEPSTVETGLLVAEDWIARFISPRSAGRTDMPAPILTRTVDLRSGVASARLYVTAHGVYIATINGVRVGDELFAPGWTSYNRRLCYQTYDVTPLLHEGTNTLAALLGNGRYRGRIGPRSRAFYGERLALLAQLEVTYIDGSVEIIGTDEKWLATESAVLDNDYYDGQRIDLRQVQSPVDSVDLLEEDLGRLVAPEGPPVRVTQVVPAVNVWDSPSGRTLVDFGQNLVGWVRIRVRNTRSGDEVTVHHAEVLEDGELCVRMLGPAMATDSYVLADADDAVLEPALTFHGFRYAEVTGVADLRTEDLEANVVGADLNRTGWFTCSDPDLERLHENIVWSTRGNFLDVPTDDPQRAERLGWTGDIQVFSPTACFLFDVAGFLDSWLADMTADQYADGSVPWVIPDVFKGESKPMGLPAAGWGDAATVVPWVLHESFGDTAILARQFDSMRGWVDRVATLTQDGVWSGGFQFGDWLAPSAPPDDPFAAAADPDVIATAYLARSAEIVAETARVLGRRKEFKQYTSLAARTRTGFAREYVTDSGRVLSDTPTVYAMALEWNLLPTTVQRGHAAQRLADLVRSDGFRATTGFLGTPLITDALTSSGHADLAYRLLFEESCPSWLHAVRMGATTVWERWDALLPDGSIHPSRMCSFNHFPLGAVADWMHRTIAGLAPAAPGYRQIEARPIPHSALSHASARHITPYGEVSVAWRRAEGRFFLDVIVPVGAQATVHIPGSDPVIVKHGQHSWTTADPCTAQESPVYTVRELIDQPRLWSEAVSVLVAHGLCKDSASVATQLARCLNLPAVDIPFYVSTFDDSIDAHPNEASHALKQLLARTA